jgi:peptidoglycan hydrolase-like protein with peptidoglycan-binding domain
MTATLSLTEGVAWRVALGAALVAGAFLTGVADANEGMHTSAARNPSAQLYASPSQVRMVQEKMNEQGRDLDVDGLWGEATMKEVREYQRANGLAPTGQLDTSLLSALGIGDVLKGEKTSSRFLDGLLRSEKAASARNTGLGAPIYVSPTHVAHIQHLLREQGHYSGAIDGTWGTETARAANRFRQAQGLEASDGLDIALLRALNQRGTAVPDPAPQVIARAEGVPLQAGPVAIRALQRELAQKGHEAGAVDGVWGENTRQAVRSFQKDHNLEPTGTLTLPTLAALGIKMAGERDVAALDE